MKLSELVKIQKKLTEFQSKNLEMSLNDDFNMVHSYVDLMSPAQFGRDRDTALENLNILNNQVKATDAAVRNLLTAVKNQIDEKTKDFYSRGYVINGSYGSDRTDVINEREFRFLTLTEDIKEEIVSNIRRYTNPKYPALEIGPGDGYLTEYMVAADPLYLVDIYEEFLNSTKSKFPEQYQRRLRTYQVGGDGVKDVNLSLLPQNQFGFILAWNVFDFFPPDMTQAYLKECFNVLRPGGSMLFSYNNGEDPVCAAYVETGFKSWMPKTLLLDNVHQLGFEVIDNISKLNGVHWLVIKKPGTLTTVKLNQALGEIITWNP